MVMKLWTPFGNSDRLLVSSTGKILVCETCPCDVVPGPELPYCPPASPPATLQLAIDSISGDTACFDTGVSPITLDYIGSGRWVAAESPITPATNCAEGACMPAGTPHGTYANCYELRCDNIFAPPPTGYRFFMKRMVYIDSVYYLNVYLAFACHAVGFIDIDRVGGVGHATNCEGAVPSNVVQQGGDNPIYVLYEDLPIFTNSIFADGDLFPVCSSTFPGVGCHLVGRVNVEITE